MATRTAPVIPTGTWTVDPAHSSVEFSVKHMGIVNVRGKFTEFEGALEMKQDMDACRVRGAVKVASIDTGDSGRDEHLRSPDFFNAQEFPEITFRLLRSTDDPRRFLSSGGAWRNAEQIEAARNLPSFQEAMADIETILEAGEISTFELVAEVS